MFPLLERIFGSTAKGDFSPAMQAHIEVGKRLDLDSLVTETDFVVFDTELTGLDFKRDSIVSIGALRMKGGAIQPTGSFYRLVRPETELKRRSVVVHEITPTELQEAASLEEVLEEFIEFIGDAVLVGHFVHIDVNFVSRALKSHFGVTLQNRAVDTGSLLEWLCDNDSRFVRHYRGITAKKDLFSIAKKYGVPAEKAHNAFYDAYVTAQLFQRFLFFLCEGGVKRLKDLLIVGKT